MTRNCPGCGSNRCEVFYELAAVPANSLSLLSSRQQAVALPRGEVALEFCDACGLVFNAAFDPGLVGCPMIDDDMDAYSPVFRTFQQRLADRLIERYALHDKDIMDIGCGRGQFLALLCELGSNHGIGFDPGYSPDPQSALAGIDATFRCELFTDDTVVGPADLVCSRMLLEQIADPTHFLGLLRRTLGLRKGARLFLQVRNVVQTLTHHAFWEIHYSRCSYLSPGTLHRLLCAQGFTVEDVWTDFDAQYLMADAHPAGGGTTGLRTGKNVETIADLASLVARFEHECREKQAMWCEILRKLAGAGNRIAIWGAGSVAASFLTTLAVGDEVSYVVDLDPHRQGKYTPGTGHRIVAPEVMVDMRPDVVIVMNSELNFEIRDLLAQAGCAPTLLIA